VAEIHELWRKIPSEGRRRWSIPKLSKVSLVKEIMVIDLKWMRVIRSQRENSSRDLL
jgi:hypothetical protein